MDLVEFAFVVITWTVSVWNLILLIGLHQRLDKQSQVLKEQHGPDKHRQ